jgi:hypothetical protein
LPNKGHCYVFAAHLYQHTAGKVTKWASVRVGALLYVKGRSIPLLVSDLARQMRLPAGGRNCWIVDRGIVSRALLRELDRLAQYLIGRLRRNQNVYFAPAATISGGEPRVYGEKCRAHELLKRCPQELRRQQMKLRVSRPRTPSRGLRHRSAAALGLQGPGLEGASHHCARAGTAP